MPQYNVSTLLKESVGAAREYDFDEKLGAEGGAVRLAGNARFIRTKTGVLVQAHAEGRANLSCSRCLEPVTVPLAVDFEEEYLQTVDVNTGARLPVAPSAENFRIDARHTLDLDEALRQYWEMAQPMAPLCRPDCAGLCPQCGARLAGEAHACSAPPLDERWSKLLDFRPYVNIESFRRRAPRPVSREETETSVAAASQAKVPEGQAGQAPEPPPPEGGPAQSVPALPRAAPPAPRVPELRVLQGSPGPPHCYAETPQRIAALCRRRRQAGPAMASVAWVFPGQGSQEAGMGRDVFEASAAARDVFGRADAILGYGLSKLCFEGPEEDLRQTVHQQPAIFVTSMALFEAARAAGQLPDAAFAAGHSLGEYTALVAAGAIGFEDGVRLVQTRGRLMQEAAAASPGTMAAIIGLSFDAVAHLCAEARAEVCNDNAPAQVVIGGPPGAVERALELARAAGAQRTVPLAVSGAFHTSLMRPAADSMAKALAGCPVSAPKIPVISNVDAQPLREAEQVRQELVWQLTSPVRWVDSVRAMVSAGATSFLEIGPGRVLTGLIRRIAPEAVIANVNSARALVSEGDSPGREASGR